MMSRDPDGINPNEIVEDSVGLEPTGSRADESFGIVANNSNVENEATPLTMDIAGLVGAPPPPPAMPPPKKIKKHTPKNSIRKTITVPQVSSGAFGSFDDDSLLQDLARSSSTMTTPRFAKEEDNVEVTAHTQNTTDTAQTDESLKVDAPPQEAMDQLDEKTSDDASSTYKLVEARVKAALALYERDELVLENDDEMIELTPQEILRPVNAAAKVRLSTTPRSQNSPAFHTSSPMKASQTPPGSITTLQETDNDAADTDRIVSDRPSPSGSRGSLPKAVSPASVENTFTSLKRTSSIERGQKAKEPKQRDKKRGFFKKLFRGRGKHPREDEVRQDEESENIVLTKEGLTPRLPSSPSREVKESPQAKLAPVLKAPKERKYDGTAPIETSTPVEDGGAAFFSQDPPDDEHGDPPVHSGRPLISPTSIVRNGVDDHEEGLRVEAVKSRIAEVIDGRSKSGAPSPKVQVQTPLQQDENNYFLTQDDEVSAITGTFGSKSFERMEGASAEHVSPAKSFDPYSTDFSANAASLPTPANAVSIRLPGVVQTQDPAGESPMHWNLRGKSTAPSDFRDPVGESPVHAWKAAGDLADDPPLNLGFDADIDAVSEIIEEKKEEDPFPEPQLLKSTSSLSATPFEQDFMSAPSKSMESTPDREEASSQPTTTVKETIEPNKESSKLSSIPTQRKYDGRLPPAVQTAVEKDGFKSASNTPVAGEKKSLSITTAAFTNAKAVAYLHRLHGEPSPRHTWHASKRKKSDLTPLAAKAKSKKDAKKKHQQTSSAKKKPSPNEYGAHNVVEALLASDDAVTSRPPVNHEELHAVRSKEGALFGAYNSKFQGRKPLKKKILKIESPRHGISLGSRGRPSLEPRSPSSGNNFYAKMKPGKITASAVSRGIKMRRSKRDEDIALGKSERVVITPKPKNEGRNRFRFFQYDDESHIKDPIQRAGRRILSKSAIPIQCAARRYIAKREAVDRMWAVIEIQSYYRRWRAEANLQASVHSATQIQAISRGWSARYKLNDMNDSATQIQKVVRGYLCQARVYDTMYYIVRLQAFFRGCYQLTMQAKKQSAVTQLQKYLRGYRTRVAIYKGSRAVPFQALYRGHKARQEYFVAVVSAKLLQATWRSYAARIAYQIEIVDIIIVQSAARRWLASRRTQSLKNTELFGPTSIIQAAWRGRCARRTYNKFVAARKIQAAWRARCARRKYNEFVAARKIQSVWRGFHCYTDYIFSLVDILVVQRTVRVFLAKREANSIRREKSATKIQRNWRLFTVTNAINQHKAAVKIQDNWRRATIKKAISKEKSAVKIQSNWRRKKAESMLLFSLVHIIVAQSVARRFLAKKIAQSLRDADLQRKEAATAIQKTWRGFWGFSHYIIVQYELARLQALVRGKLARQSYNLKLGCAIIIQATIRRHLAKNTISKKRVKKAAFEADALALRERNASKKIQFWWRIVLDWTKEKKAALTIERFFIHVREEVDREIMRRERKKILKKEKRRLSRRDDDKMLEKAWLKTVDENTAISGYSNSSRSQSAPRLREGSLAVSTHRTPRIANQLISPKLSSVGQEVDINGWPIQRVDSLRTPRSRPPTDTVQMAISHDLSEVSNITNPTYFNRADAPSGRSSRRMSTEDYIKKYGGGNDLKSAPNRMAAGNSRQHFFSDDGSVGSSKIERSGAVGHGLPVVIPPTPRSISGTSPARRRSSSTPRSQHSDGFGQVTPRGFASSSFNGGRSKASSSATTPRNNYGVYTSAQTPRSTSSSHQVASPRIQVGYPPVTPRTYKGGSKLHICRGDTAETESQTTYTQNSFSHPSPRSGRDVNHGRSPVRVIKKYSNHLSQSLSNGGGQDLMYLEGEELGDEFGEV